MNIAKKKIAYITLGCKLNFSETSTLKHLLENAGAETVEEDSDADIFIINTCSVTDIAEKKDRQLIRKIAHHHPNARIVVTGCYAQLRAEEIKGMEGISLVLGAKEKFNIVEHLLHLEEEQQQPISSQNENIFQIRQFDLAYSFGDRTRCFLKIQDGCDYFCSYCTIPYARGRSRSASIPQVLEAVSQVAAKGIKEIILTGVNTGDFGRDQQANLLDLLHQLDARDDIARYRISSIEPNLLTEEIIEFVASSRHFMPHFHIPLQAGNDEVLRLMRRRYNRDLFASKVQAIKSILPDAFIGVDVIAGMRGETRACFEDSRDFIASLPISQLHVFPYSERQGTKALEIPLTVPQEEKHNRVAELIRISERKHHEFCSQFKGNTRPVLFEDNNTKTYIYGFTDNYIKVRLPYAPQLVNTISPIFLNKGIIQENKNQ